MKKYILHTIIAILLIIIGFMSFFAFKHKDKSSLDEPSIPEKYTCPWDSNTGWTECMFGVLDRASAEREWKQRKLEIINDKQVNTYNMTPRLVDEQKKIREWREGFETSRDAWCKARESFNAGSGTPGGIAQCEVEFELLAIKDLNFLYYNVIVDFNSSIGIPDFEPTDADIDALVKANTPKRLCGWSREEVCK